MKKALKWTIISLVVIIALAAAAGGLVFYMLRPAQLTPLVNRFITEFLDADVSFNSVELSIREEFPKISIKLVEGQIISHAMRADTAYLAYHPQGVDTLIRFNELMVSLNAMDLLGGSINVERIRLSQPTVNAYVSPSGRANWEIFAETEADTAAANTADDMPFELNIERFSIRGPAKISFTSVPDSISLQAAIKRQLRLRGNITPDMENMEIHRFFASQIELDFRSYSETMNMHSQVSLDSLLIDGILTPNTEKIEINRFVLSQVEVGHVSNSDSMDLRASIGRVLLDGKVTSDTAQLEAGRFVLSKIEARHISHADSMDTQAAIGEVVLEGKFTPDTARLEVNSFALSQIEFKHISHSDSMRATVGKALVEGKFTPDTERLEIGKIAISDVNFNGEFKSDDASVRLLLSSAAFSAVENLREYNAEINATVWATAEKQVFANSLPLKLSGGLLLNPENFQFSGFRNFGLTIANLPELQLNGKLALAEDGLDADLEARITALPIQRALALVPAGISDEVDKIQTNIAITLDAKIKGKYEFAENGKMPAVVADIRIPEGSLTYKQSETEESKVENFAIDATLSFDPASPQNTGINIRNIALKAVGATLNGNLNATNILEDPNVAINLSGTANLREVLQFAPEDLGITARGNVGFKADGTFLLSHLNERDLARNNLIVQVNADRVRLRIPQDTISIMVERTNLELNTTHRRVSGRTGEERRQIAIDFRSDSARVRLPSRETVAFNNVNLSARSSDDVLAGANESVIPMSGTFTAGMLQYTALDSSTVTLREVKTNLRMRGQRENRALPAITFDTEAARLSVRGTDGSRFSVRDANIALTANRNDPNQQRTRSVNLDSLQILFPEIERDSLAAHARRLRRESREPDDFAGEDIDIRNTEVGALLREWALDGSIKSRSGRMVSPMFPLSTRLQNIDLLFTSNDATLQNIGISLGESRINITGKIDNIRRAMNTGRGLRIETVIKADTLNINELLTAIQAGAAFAESSEEQKRAIAGAEDEDQLERMLQEMSEGAEAAPQLVVMPSNISIDAKLDIRNGKYADIAIHRLTGGLLIRDRVLQLNDLSAQTSMGGIDLTALYATRSRTDITLGLDLEFKNIQVEDFISVIPAVDEFAPMLSSFRGIVSAQLAATMALDSTMDIMLPSINASCRISGRNMVLLDGKDFAEIAKALRFRNREENLVDSISVEMLISDNQIRIFPFVMEMDRYRVAVSGVQNLDMSFSYHISVLRSPIPFRMGVNISGTEDNMRFRLGRARYRDDNMPTHVTIIDETRINLRSQIDNFLQHGIDAAQFSQFSAPASDQSSAHGDVGEMTAQDSLALYREGMTEFRPANIEALEARELEAREAGNILIEEQPAPRNRNRREERNRRRGRGST
ncbi:MAG: AsmA family protein [Chitinispirillales bacterium]|nr:AsmA family protein [Chitinispirillales bacterium]